MRLSILSSELKRAMKMALRVIERKNVLPILDNVLFYQDPERDNRMNMIASSPDRTIVMQLNLSLVSGEYFPLAINANTLSGVINELPECALEIEATAGCKNTEVVLSWKGGDFHTIAANASEYPKPSSRDEVVSEFTVDADLLMPSLAAATTFVEFNENKPTISGVCVNTSNDGFCVVGTDTHRLYRYVHEPGMPFLAQGSPASAIIPIQSMQSVNALSSPRGKVSVAMLGDKATSAINRIRFTTDDTELVMRTAEGRYPRVDAIIPRNHPHHVTFNVAELRRAIRLIMLAANSATKQIKMEVIDGSLMGSTTRWVAQDIDFSRKAQQELAPVVSARLGGDTPDCSLPGGYAIGMKANYVMDMLSHIPTENVIFELGEPNRPILVMSDEVNSPTTMLVMPMALTDY